MEANKEEAERCIQLAEGHIKENNRAKAERFLHKAERLFSTQRAKDLLVRIQFIAPSATEGEPKLQMFKADEPATPQFTKDQLDAVKRINSFKDYYEILGINKDATDSTIKKNYKRLALLLHPDKNKCPGSAKAFQAIGKAVDVLTDPEKRKKYDLHGPEEERVAQSYHDRGFESDTTEEDNHQYNNMFFQPEQPKQTGFAPFVKHVPMILAILLSIALSLFISDPMHSLQLSGEYTVLRRTEKLRLPYFVKDNFHTKYQGSVKRLDVSIEEDHLANLRHACTEEMIYRDYMMAEARSLGNHDEYHSAQNLKTPSCEKYRNLRKHGA